MRLMDIPLLQGRDFDSRDRADTQPVAIVNQAFVDQYLPGEDALGRQFKLGLETSRSRISRSPALPRAWSGRIFSTR